MESSHDRDDYVTILWDNIEDGAKSYFKMYSDRVHHGASYDYRSLMHSPAYIFSKNGKPTIMPHVRLKSNTIPSFKFQLISHFIFEQGQINVE